MSQKNQIAAFARQVVTYCKKFEAISQEDLSLEALLVRQKELESKFNKLNEHYYSIISDVEDGQEVPSYEARYEEANEAYLLLLTQLEIKINKKRAPTDNTDPNATMNSTANHQQSVRLPTVNIPLFEGGYSKWPAFRDLFCGVFHNLSAGQKLAHLHDRTRGEAKDIVARYDIVDANFELAWQALIDRYENTRILVHQQMKKLFGIQVVHQESPKALRVVQGTINDSLAIFKSHKIEVKYWDPILNHLCATKIPEETLRAWEDSLLSHKTLPTWAQMDAFLACRIEKLETVMDLRKPHQREQHNSKALTFYTQDRGDHNDSCIICNQNHFIWQCKQFRSMSPQNRSKLIMDKGCCLNCMSKGHFSSKCPSTRSCKQCNRRHHTMLHMDREGQHAPRSTNQASTSQASNQMQSNDIVVHFSTSPSTTILPTALINLIHAGEKFTIRALLDGGAEKSFISARVQQRLQLPVEWHRAQISGLGGTVVSNSKGRCTVMLGSKCSDFTINIKVIIVPKLSHLLPSRPVHINNLGDIQHLTLADPYFYKPGPIDMIIGSDFLPYINCEGVQTYEGCLEARASNFGWYISGPAPEESVQTFSTTVADTSEICTLLKNFWELEEVEKPKAQSDSDTYCEEFYRETTQRGDDGKFIVRLPFKREFPEEIYLGPSKHMAFAQYARMETTLAKTPDLQKQYTDVLQDYEDLKHMQEVKEQERGEKVSSFFLPHHAVLKPESTSTKVRVVFNASKKSKSGFSLNDVLYTGPVLQADIVQVISNWRLYQFVFTGDIQKMYRQIWIHQDDRVYQQILFRRNKQEPVKSFQLNTVTFGINCAPFLAIRTLLELSKNVESSNPAASAILSREVYVDDILSGGYSLEEARQKQDDLKFVLATAGFPVKKVAANHSSLLDYLPREDLLNEEFLKIDTCSITKTLGVRWNAIADVFSYTVQHIDTPTTVTKRQILSVIAKLYDPQGWIGPIVVVAKILMQELWELKADWDEIVPANLFSKWLIFLTNLPILENLQIPRWVNFSPTSTIQLHGFSDASEKAYCGVVYIRCTSPSGIINCHLVVAKTKVAPLQQLTIPKLELCGALLLTNLITTVSKNLKFQHKITLWTDSAIVLGWLQRKPQTLKTFVANRIADIQKLASASQWKHIKTSENPADLGSRGCTPQELLESQLWWNGPSWLKLPEEQWPKPRSFEPTDLDVKHKVLTHFTTETTDITTRFSSLERCIRVVCYIFRFYNNLRKNQKFCHTLINAEEVEYTKHRLIQLAQQSHYSRELSNLQNQLNIHAKSSIISLNPFIDESGLLRVGGRISHAELSYSAKHPIIVPPKSHIAELIVNFTHKILLHAEFQLMIRAIRQGYYIPQLKNLIRKCIRSCKACTIYKHNFKQQIMGSLPPERVQFSPPFTYTGVDFAGPFNLKTSQLKNAKVIKGYAAVFVCFSTKAVHLETCSELSTEAFLATFSRFVGRRGLPRTMFSDNGRNFLGASSALLKEHHKFLQTTEEALVQKYNLHGFKWSFIPPYSPHMGGLWESAVKSMKSHLKKVAANINFTFEEFSTLLVRIEAVLNSRPLSPLSQSPGELLPLTPGHFLRGAPLTAVPEVSSITSLDKLPHITRWERLKAIQHIFAQRWKSEYVAELQRRYKWKSTKENIKIDDFVIIREDFLPPTEWKLGRISKLYLGKDQNARVADILTQNGTITRPLVKLCVLPHVIKSSA